MSQKAVRAEAHNFDISCTSVHTTFAYLAHKQASLIAYMFISATLVGYSHDGESTYKATALHLNHLRYV